tara:strand:- start:3266 stop:3664 length:399 start_codon:yes stop_codon:yes gene_type:complete
MKIECPKCFKENNLNLEAKVNCGHCKEEITGYTYKKPLISATTALMIGAGGFYAVDQVVLADDRYPVTTEYSIIDSCLNNYREPIAYRIYDEKREVCICTLEKTMEEFSYNDFKEGQEAFIKVFEGKVKECR